MKSISKFTYWAAAAVMLLLIGPTSANHKDLDIECEGTLYPSCCTAISDSGGSAPINYYWTATKGWYEQVNTSYNWTIHHCTGADTGSFSLNNSVDQGTLYGHGTGSCSSNN